MFGFRKAKIEKSVEVVFEEFLVGKISDLPRELVAILHESNTGYYWGNYSNLRGLRAKITPSSWQEIVALKTTKNFPCYLTEWSGVVQGSQIEMSFSLISSATHPTPHGGCLVYGVQVGLGDAHRLIQTFVMVRDAEWISKNISVLAEQYHQKHEELRRQREREEIAIRPLVSLLK